MLSRRLLLPLAALLVVAAPFAATPLATAQSERHGRKFKAPPDTSHLEVLVVRDATGKVIENAAVIFHPTKDGNDEGNLEIKSGPDGKAFIDIIPTGSDVAVQVIANGFTTHAQNIKLTQPSQQITVRMMRPKAQVSAYDETGKTVKLGVQEPVQRTLPPAQAEPKPLSADQPVLKLPALPAKAKGDPTIPGSNGSPANSTPVKPPTDTSAPATPPAPSN